MVWLHEPHSLGIWGCNNISYECRTKCFGEDFWRWVYALCVRQETEAFWGTLAKSLWIWSHSSTECLQERRIRWAWMGWLLWNMHKLSWAFHLAWLWPCLMLWSRGALPSWPSAPASPCLVCSGGWGWTLAAPELCQNAVSLYRNDSFLKKKASSFLHLSELLQGLIFQKDPALSAIRQLWLRSDVLHKFKGELALLIDGRRSKMSCSFFLSCKGS